MGSLRSSGRRDGIWVHGEIWHHVKKEGLSGHRPCVSSLWASCTGLGAQGYVLAEPFWSSELDRWVGNWMRSPPQMTCVCCPSPPASCLDVMAVVTLDDVCLTDPGALLVGAEHCRLRSWEAWCVNHTGGDAGSGNYGRHTPLRDPHSRCGFLCSFGFRQIV